VWADIPNNRERAHCYFYFIILPFTSKREIEEARAKVIRWRLREDGEGMVVQNKWQVVTHKKWMNLLAPLAKPPFRWNHDQVMRHDQTY